MSIHAKSLAALLVAAVVIPTTSFAYWLPNNSEQGGTEVVDWSNMKSRTQVLEELEQAKSDPSWNTRLGEETGTWALPNTGSSRTRAQVRQELEEITPQERAYIQSFYSGA